MWKDAGGREWSTAITAATVKRVLESAGVLLTDLETIERIERDVLLLADVLCAIAAPQREGRQVTSEQFGELLYGEVIDQAAASLRQDIIDFFPPGRRKIIQQIYQTTQKLEQETVSMLEARLTDDQVTAIVKRAGEQVDLNLAKLGGGSGRSPEPSGSTPAD
jgi:parvulin-like peptidyl-prolyl isomerase